MSGFKTTSQNPCDFFALVQRYFFMLECKETTEGTINFSKISQLDRLADYIGMDGVFTYIIIWFSSKDKVLAVSAEEAVRIKGLGHKSISLKMLGDEAYNIIDLPAKKKRVFMDTDFTALISEVAKIDESRHQ